MGWLTNKIAPELLVWPRTPFSLRARPRTRQQRREDQSVHQVKLSLLKTKCFQAPAPAWLWQGF